MIKKARTRSIDEPDNVVEDRNGHQHHQYAQPGTLRHFFNPFGNRPSG
jgi:hypothetical protein